MVSVCTVGGKKDLAFLLVMWKTPSSAGSFFLRPVCSLLVSSASTVRKWLMEVWLIPNEEEKQSYSHEDHISFKHSNFLLTECAFFVTV